MDGVPQPGPWWHAVGAPLERLVRPRSRVRAPTRRCSASCPAAWSPRSALPAVTWQDFKPPCLSSCRRGQCRPRRPNELTNDHSCPRSAVLRFSTLAPSNCVCEFVNGNFSRESPTDHAVGDLSDQLALIDRTALRSMAHGHFAYVEFTPTGTESAGAPHGLFFVRPNVRAKRVTTAWRAGQQAQNGPQAQRLMASVTCRWRSA